MDKEKEIEEIMQLYNRFLEIVKQLSMTAEEQIAKLEGTVVSDEIAIDFSEIGMRYANELLEYGWITIEQFLFAKSIDEAFSIMSQRTELWSEDALRNSKEWEHCRKKGKELLSMLE